VQRSFTFGTNCAAALLRLLARRMRRRLQGYRPRRWGSWLPFWMRVLSLSTLAALWASWQQPWLLNQGKCHLQAACCGRQIDRSNVVPPRADRRHQRGTDTDHTINRHPTGCAGTAHSTVTYRGRLWKTMSLLGELFPNDWLKRIPGSVWAMSYGAQRFCNTNSPLSCKHGGEHYG
jgi:hypothetical protein